MIYWASKQKPKGMSLMKFIEKEFPKVDFIETYICKGIIRGKGVGRIIYSACKRKDKNTDVIFGMVILTGKNGEYIDFKSIEENEHPYYYDCPKKIISLLSKTENTFSLEWRNNCLKKSS